MDLIISRTVYLTHRVVVCPYFRTDSPDGAQPMVQ
jgi:hypothetical protein